MARCARYYNGCGMDFSKFALMQGISGKLDWLNHRQSVTALNIANADTPGYVSQDLKPFSFQAAVEQALPAPKATHHAHVVAAPAAGLTDRPDDDRNPYELSPDGNAVVLEEQMIRAAESAMEHSTMTMLYQKQIGLFKIALGRGR